MLNSLSRQEVTNFVSSAFEDVQLGEGVGIFEADAIDNYASADERRKARKRDRCSWIKWQDIPESVIDSIYWVLCFVDAEGMRFLLPAYMRFALENYDTNDSASIDSSIYSLDRGVEAFGGNTELLSEAQLFAISQFLRFMILVAGDDFVDTTVASRAYENHWAQYDTAA